MLKTNDALSTFRDIAVCCYISIITAFVFYPCDLFYFHPPQCLHAITHFYVLSYCRFVFRCCCFGLLYFERYMQIIAIDIASAKVAVCFVYLRDMIWHGCHVMQLCRCKGRNKERGEEHVRSLRVKSVGEAALAWRFHYLRQQ